MTNLITQAIQTDDIDAALVLLQDALGIERGDVAGQMFAGMEELWPEMPLPNRTRLIGEYLKVEAIYAQPMLGVSVAP